MQSKVFDGYTLPNGDTVLICIVVFTDSEGDIARLLVGLLQALGLFWQNPVLVQVAE